MDEYVEQLLKDAGLPESTDPEVKNGLTHDLSTRASELVNRRLVESLGEEDLKSFNTLLDEKPDDLEAMQQFISDHVENKEKVVGAALLEFRALYLGAKA